MNLRHTLSALVALATVALAGPASAQFMDEDDLLHTTEEAGWWFMDEDDLLDFQDEDDLFWGTETIATPGVDICMVVTPDGDIGLSRNAEVTTAVALDENGGLDLAFAMEVDPRIREAIERAREELERAEELLRGVREAGLLYETGEVAEMCPTWHR